MLHIMAKVLQLLWVFYSLRKDGISALMVVLASEEVADCWPG